MLENEAKQAYSHQEYRRAKVVHIVTKEKEEKYYFKGKIISKQEADEITNNYFKMKPVKE